jgi:hypothetical protein
MGSEKAQICAKKKSNQSAFGRNVGHPNARRATAFYANNSSVGYFCSTITAIHNDKNSKVSTNLDIIFGF